ncbi:hypothetical protein CE91St36_20520 [Christensenellaceae bacterium]|nr:hypothetical protein CE91St36_20520 [Christensenellaceae bacterium]BDF61901.1 hypothetical protein CE91St37_20510 [Christensenellaceae bacterium]
MMSMSPYHYYSAPFFLAGGLLAFWIILAAVFYVFFALGLYTMAKRRGLENPWLAWIPVVYLYVIGKLADTYAAKHMNKKTNYAVLLLGLIIGVVVLAIVTVCLSIFGGFRMYAIWPVFIVILILFIAAMIVYAVFYYISLYRIYNWHSESATVLLVLSILFSVIVPFVLFALRNGDNRYLYPPQQPGGGQYYAPQQPYQQAQYPQQQPPQDTPPGNGNAQ